MVQQGKKGIGIVGARALPASFQGQVSGVVSYLVQKGFCIHSGGALGADNFALNAVIAQGACTQAVIFSPWAVVSGFPVAVQSSIHKFIAYGGTVNWGFVSPAAASKGVVIAGLLARNNRLVKASAGIVAFMCGKSSGTKRTVLEAIRLNRRVIVFLCGNASLPQVSSGVWVQLGGTSPFAGAYLFLPATTAPQRKPLPYSPCAVASYAEAVA